MLNLQYMSVKAIIPSSYIKVFIWQKQIGAYLFIYLFIFTSINLFLMLDVVCPQQKSLIPFFFFYPKSFTSFSPSVALPDQCVIVKTPCICVMSFLCYILKKGNGGSLINHWVALWGELYVCFPGIQQRKHYIILLNSGHMQ